MTDMHSDARHAFFGALTTDAALWCDFYALCDFGGRLTGTSGEIAARDWAAARMQAIGGKLRRDRVSYEGWVCRSARLIACASGTELAVAPLLIAASTSPGGVELEVLDLGRGAPEQIRAAGDAVRGKAVLVRHEYPFASWTVHRRMKIAAAMEAGAAAFLIAQEEPGIGVVSGSAGNAPIPALGLSAEAAARLTAGPGPARVRLFVDAADEPAATTETLVLDLPGSRPGKVVLSAHIDGHSLAESALDNATGVAAALSLTRAAAPHVAGLARGLTLCLFSAEEWALTGSRHWLEGLDAATRTAMTFNLNLDSIAGSPRLTALTSDFPALGAFARSACAELGLDVGVHQPLMQNSDHANFAAHGIPAMRLIAGFDEPRSALRLLLSPADTRLLVAPGELKAATLTAGAILWRALTAPDVDLVALRECLPSDPRSL